MRGATRAGLALLLLVLTAWPARAEWALGPGAEPAARQLAKALSDATGLAPGPTRIAGGAVSFTLRDTKTDRIYQVVLRHDGAGVATVHGALEVPEGLAPDHLARAANGVNVTLPWVEVGASQRPLTEAGALPKTDEAARAKVLAARLAQRAARDAAEATAAPAAFPPSPALDLSAARARLRSTHGDPDAWVDAALAARDARRPLEAIALADVATRMEQPSPRALALWRALHAPPSNPLGFSLLLALVTLVWLVLSWRTARALFPIVAVAAMAGLAAWLALGGSAAPTAAPPALPDALVAPLAGGPCAADPALWTPDGLVIYATCGDGPAAFTVSPRAADAPGATERHAIRAEIERPGPAADAASHALRAAVLDAEAAGFTLAPYPADPPAGARRLPAAGSADALESRLAAAFVAAALITLLALIWLLAKDLLAAARADRVTAWTLGALTAATLLLHLLLPDRLVMVYTGYDLTARLALLADLPRYGAGAVWLYQPFLTFLGVDHASLQVANRLLGALSLLPFAVLAFAVVPGRRLGPLCATALFALLPVVLRDHVSEAILAGTTFLLLTGLAAAALALTRPARRTWLMLALPVLAAAITCRPEVAPALAPALLGLALSKASPPEITPRIPMQDTRRTHRITVALAAACLALAALPHLAWLLETARQQAQDGSIVAPQLALSTRVAEVLTRANIFLDGPWLSPALLVWPLAALLTSRRLLPTHLGLITAAALWLALSAVDLPEVSIPRVHLPALVLLLPVVGAGIERLADSPRLPLRLVNPFVAALVFAGAVASVSPLFTPSNADAEDALIRSARSALPPSGGCLATVRFDDPPPPGHTQRHFPDYLFPGTTIVGLERFDADRAARANTCEGGAVALLGTRCYMALRPPDAGPPEGPPELPVCTRFRARYALEPVVDQRIDNRTAHTFPMYPAIPELHVGVYRIGARRGGGGEGQGGGGGEGDGEDRRDRGVRAPAP
ncbi:MAG: hypothetical protein R3F39_04300 [Myxococcota bacterium]